jgi:hypothetical protein
MATRVLLTVAFSAVCAAAAQSQDAPAVDPVMACFREFRGALERGDSQAAESDAERCLELSERLNGAKTAVLALNLAEVRLDRGEPDSAYAPAQRAYELATASSSSGVEPLLAELTLGRAQLAVDRENGVERLREAIAEAERDGTAQSDAYVASIDLARTSFMRGEYDIAREAWAAAARLAGASSDDPKIARGLARTGEGAAIFMQATIDARRSTVAAVLGTAIEVPAAREASAAFAEALDLLQPSADSTDEHALTLAQRGYAEALAWDGALRAKMQSQGEDLPHADRRPAADGRCSLRLVPDPAPNYPHDALLGSGFGAVVMRVQTDARGAIVHSQVAAAIPTGSFSDAVEAVSGKWRVEVEPGAAPGCRRDGTQYTPILFVADAGQEQQAAGLVDEIIVHGRTPPALRVEIERAEDAVFERFNAITSNREFEIHCELEKATGTRIPQRVCAPNFLHQAQERAGRDVVLALQGFSGAQTEEMYAGQASVEYKQLEGEMKKLASEDPQFFSALQHLVELREAAKEAAKRGQ